MQLFETEGVENKPYARSPKTALGAGGRVFESLRRPSFRDEPIAPRKRLAIQAGSTLKNENKSHPLQFSSGGDSRCGWLRGAYAIGCETRVTRIVTQPVLFTTVHDVSPAIIESSNCRPTSSSRMTWKQSMNPNRKRVTQFGITQS